MSSKRNERYKAEHCGQVYVDVVAPAYQLGTVGDAVKNMGIEIQVRRQKHNGVHQRKGPRDFVVNEREAGEADSIQVIDTDVQ